ncbi:MAG: nitroreductase [Pseudomonadota bacterium]
MAVSSLDPSNPHWPIVSRRSIRRFLPTPVARETVVRILDAAAHSASGHNIQPWKVYVVEGNTKQKITENILNVIATEPEARHQPEFDYYPTDWFEPYIGRRRDVGFKLYELLGIAREDKEGRTRQLHENFHFFGATVGLFLTFDRRLATGTYMDMGMFLQSIMVAARIEGLDTCAQAIFTWYHKVLRDILPIQETEILVCGMSLGYADPEARENQLVAPKQKSNEFTHYFS